LTIDALHPSWKRKQENDADRFAVDVVVLLGYSMARGPKAMLDRLAQVDEARRKAAGPPKSAVTTTTTANSGSFSVNFSQLAKNLLRPLSETHADSATRAEIAVKYYEEKWENSPQRKKSTRKNKDVASLIKTHEQISAARSLAVKGELNKAVAQASAGKKQTNTSLITNMAYCDLLVDANLTREAQRCFEDSARISAGSWLPTRALANSLKSNGRGADALSAPALGFEKLGRPTILLPEIVTLTRDIDEKTTFSYMKECFTAGPTLFVECERAKLMKSDNS
jgi:hypothetical protein